ncbi:MAG: NFACT family protein [Clostridia bacterium]|nr:NFACT family protein [Clostridia bacterium]
MATDGFTLYACVHELQALVGGKIDKVQQPDKDIVILHIHAPNTGRVKLMLCIHAENGRIQTVSRNYENPGNAPAFCMLLRKYLIGCRIVSIEQKGLNRIAVFSLSGRNEFFDAVEMRLVAELMGRHGNLFLLDENGTIIDCLRHFGIGENASRICLPNIAYSDPPETEKLDPFTATASEIAAISEGRMPGKWLTDAFHGVSRLCAEQIVKDGTPENRIADEIRSVFSDIRDCRFTPSVIPGVGVLPFRPRNIDSVPCSSVNEAQDLFYRSRDEQAILTRLRTSMRTVLEHARKRTEKKLAECMKAIGDEAHIERDKLYGELLFGVHGVPAGRSSVAVPNYYTDPPETVEIPLDPKFSVSENAQRYFKRYRKNKAARAYALEQTDALNAELDYLKGQLLNVAACSTREELAEIREELIRERYIREQQEQRRTDAAVRSRPLHYRMPDGTDVFVGKNNLQNEKLVRTSDPNAIWLHAKGVPASHVILNAAEPTRETLYLAAMIAAYHSGASASENVPIDYTQVRYVKKPAGARPGFVNYYHQHTLYVTPSLSEIAPYRVGEDK